MKSFAKIAAVGLSAVVMLKLFAAIIFPLMGLVFGLIGLTMKLALVAAVALFIYTVFFKKDEEEKEMNPEREIVVEMEVEEEDDDDDD